MSITILTTKNQYKKYHQKPLLKSAIKNLLPESVIENMLLKSATKNMLPKSDTKNHYWKLLWEIVTKKYYQKSLLEIVICNHYQKLLLIKKNLLWIFLMYIFKLES